MSPGTYLHIPTYTYVYMHIYAYTYTYMHIHAHTQRPQVTKKSQKCWRGASLMHPPGKNKYLISAHASGSCTMLAGGRFGKVLACPEHPGGFYGRGKTGPNTDSWRKNRKIGSEGGVGMGSKSGRAHALGCPEWVPPGAGSRGGVLGMLWWFPCPSGPMHAIAADTDGILMHTCIYMHILTIPTYTYIQIHTGSDKIPTAVTYLHDTAWFLQIHEDTCIYALPWIKPTPPQKYLCIPTYTRDTCIYLHCTYLQIVVLTLNFLVRICRYHVGIM